MSRLGWWIGRLAKRGDDEKIRVCRRLMCDIWRLKQLLRAEKVEPVATYNMQYQRQVERARP